MKCPGKAPGACDAVVGLCEFLQLQPVDKDTAAASGGASGACRLADPAAVPKAACEKVAVV